MKMPNEILVYISYADRDTHEPIFAVARSLDEIPEDADGKKIGVYILDRELKFKIERKLVA